MRTTGNISRPQCMMNILAGWIMPSIRMTWIMKKAGNPSKYNGVNTVWHPSYFSCLL